MKSDDNLQLKIAQHIKRDPLLRDVDVTVELVERQATITGKVNKFFKKGLLWNAVRKITGVKNISDQIQVRLSDSNQFLDSEIAAAINEKLKINLGNSFQNIVVSVRSGHVILEGTVNWKYQKILAFDCISYVDGIVSIQNNLTMGFRQPAFVNEKDVLAAIYSDESIASDIGVNINGRIVTVSGDVPTVFQKKLVEKLVRDMPDVESVENRLQVVKQKPSS